MYEHLLEYIHGPGWEVRQVQKELVGLYKVSNSKPHYWITISLQSYRLSIFIQYLNVEMKHVSRYLYKWRLFSGDDQPDLEQEIPRVQSILDLIDCMTNR